MIDEVASAELQRGFEVAVYNGRGIVSRDPAEGGVRYPGFAVALSDHWPRTAAMLRRLADRHRAEARRENQEAELEEDLGR
ncbi:MAG: hypothetical protein ACE5JR_13980 [Gemmatimonadota bacterium]